MAESGDCGPDNHFSKELRLLRPAEFKRVFEKARKAGNGSMTLLARQNTLGRPRLGLAIAKKSVRLAVQRNRIKRMVRESFRHHQGLLDGLDIVFIARPGLDQLAADEFRSALSRHWRSLAERCVKSS